LVIFGAVKNIVYPYPVKSIQTEQYGEIAYVDEGSGGKTIVFIHGLSNYCLAWKKNIDYLRSSFRCVSIDLPGNGLSEKADRPYSIGFYANAVETLIKKLGLGNICLAGHSMGGQIALTIALRQPAWLSELVLCAPAGLEYFSPFEASAFRTGMNFMEMFTSEEHNLKETIRSGFFQDNRQADEILGNLVKILGTYPAKEYKKMLDRSIHGMLHEPVFNSLHLIEYPALIFFGEQDNLIPNRFMHPGMTTREIAVSGAGKMKNAKLKMITRAGHFVQWEKANEVNREIHSFLMPH
jgi:pimeloyl-ACP methyl ester carboxylesterase